MSGEPYIIVLGIAQDGGVPRRRQLVTSLGLVDPASQQRWLFDATPDFPEQLARLQVSVPSGIFLTHAHIGHYTGLMYLGHEAMGARNVPVYAMPRMMRFLQSNGPWDQLVQLRNIDLRPLSDGCPVQLNERLSVTPILVPHRQEYSETVGYRITGPRWSALFIPDIDSWELIDSMGDAIERLVCEVDVAYLDGTFFSADELPNRDMKTVPHPLITDTMRRFGPLPAPERAKVRFIHLNHTNPALRSDSDQRRRIVDAGFSIAGEMERFDL